MSKDMGFIKFEMMIDEIYAEWSGKELAGCLYDEAGRLVNDGYYTVWMAAIYDYHKLNDYGKMIMDKVCGMTEADETAVEEVYSQKMEFLEKCQDMEFRIKFAKALAADLKEQKSGMGPFGRLIPGASPYTPKLHLLFWALMILAVDDTDKEEHLSRICDLAQMMEVAEAELMDMVNVIKAIFNVEGDYTFQTFAVSNNFIEVIIKYEKRDRVEEGIRRQISYPYF